MAGVCDSHKVEAILPLYYYILLGGKAVHQFDPRGFVRVRQNQKLCVVDPGA